MGKALIIGAGGVAGVAIHKCCQNSDVFTDFVQTAQHHNAELGCVLFFCHKAILS